MRIETDNKWKPFKCGYEVPQRIREEYDHLAEEEKSDGWFCYRRRWYHLSDFMRCEESNPFGKWHGYIGDSFFSGVLIKLSDDGEKYIVGTYFS